MEPSTKIAHGGFPSLVSPQEGVEVEPSRPSGIRSVINALAARVFDTKTPSDDAIATIGSLESRVGKIGGKLASFITNIIVPVARKNKAASFFTSEAELSNYVKHVVLIGMHRLTCPEGRAFILGTDENPVGFLQKLRDVYAEDTHVKNKEITDALADEMLLDEKHIEEFFDHDQQRDIRLRDHDCEGLSKELMSFIFKGERHNNLPPLKMGKVSLGKSVNDPVYYCVERYLLRPLFKTSLPKIKDLIAEGDVGVDNLALGRIAPAVANKTEAAVKEAVEKQIAKALDTIKQPDYFGGAQEKAKELLSSIVPKDIVDIITGKPIIADAEALVEELKSDEVRIAQKTKPFASRIADKVAKYVGLCIHVVITNLRTHFIDHPNYIIDHINAMVELAKEEDKTKRDEGIASSINDLINVCLPKKAESLSHLPKAAREPLYSYLKDEMTSFLQKHIHEYFIIPETVETKESLKTSIGDTAVNICEATARSIEDCYDKHEQKLLVEALSLEAVKEELPDFLRKEAEKDSKSLVKGILGELREQYLKEVPEKALRGLFFGRMQHIMMLAMRNLNNNIEDLPAIFSDLLPLEKPLAAKYVTPARKKLVQGRLLKACFPEGSKSMPVPSAMQELIYKKFKEELFPQLVDLAHNVIKRPKDFPDTKDIGPDLTDGQKKAAERIKEFLARQIVVNARKMGADKILEALGPKATEELGGIAADRLERVMLDAMPKILTHLKDLIKAEPFFLLKVVNKLGISLQNHFDAYTMKRKDVVDGQQMFLEKLYGESILSVTDRQKCKLDHTKKWASKLLDVAFPRSIKTDEDGNAVLDEDGNAVLVRKIPYIAEDLQEPVGEQLETNLLPTMLVEMMSTLTEEHTMNQIVANTLEQIFKEDTEQHVKERVVINHKGLTDVEVNGIVEKIEAHLRGSAGVDKQKEIKVHYERYGESLVNIYISCYLSNPDVTKVPKEKKKLLKKVRGIVRAYSKATAGEISSKDKNEIKDVVNAEAFGKVAITFGKLFVKIVGEDKLPKCRSLERTIGNIMAQNIWKMLQENLDSLVDNIIIDPTNVWLEGAIKHDEAKTTANSEELTQDEVETNIATDKLKAANAAREAISQKTFTPLRLSMSAIWKSFSKTVIAMTEAFCTKAEEWNIPRPFTKIPTGLVISELMRFVLRAVNFLAIKPITLATIGIDNIYKLVLNPALNALGFRRIHHRMEKKHTERVDKALEFFQSALHENLFWNIVDDIFNSGDLVTPPSSPASTPPPGPRASETD